MKTIVVLLGCLSLIWALSSSAADAQSAPRDVNVEQFEKLRSDKDNVVLDVRTKKEFEAGHMPGALNIDFNAPDFVEKMGKLDKSKTYLVHCAVGGRSKKACQKLSPLGFQHLYNLEGGYNAWAQAGHKGEK